MYFLSSAYLNNETSLKTEMVFFASLLILYQYQYYTGALLFVVVVVVVVTFAVTFNSCTMFYGH
jgi:hypothetical protein